MLDVSTLQRYIKKINLQEKEGYFLQIPLKTPTFGGIFFIFLIQAPTFCVFFVLLSFIINRTSKR